jgi:glycosyltransferase involved in cell wall biosynthesis
LPRRGFRHQIATFHDLFVLTNEYSSRKFRERFASQAREAAAAADLVIAVSAFTASQLENVLKVPKPRIRIVHHGVVPRVIPQRPRENLVLSVGAIQRRKNQARLVRAFGAMPEGWHLLLAGSQGFEAAETLQEIARSPRAQSIRVTGYVSDRELSELYARASIFAFPSLDEGFGMPVLEAMAAGIPVVTSNRSSLPEVAGGAALLVDPQDEDELASALLLLAKNEARRRELTARGLLRSQQFLWRNTVAKTMEVYAALR